MIPAFHVVLVEPEIPPNTGNIARLCAATGCHLHLVGPLGFRLDDSALKRAGMDYWRLVKWDCHDSFELALAGRAEDARIYAVETGEGTRYADARFKRGDWLVFGRETKGLPRRILERGDVARLTIPMPNPEARSLNLSNCVAVVVYEALRQTGF